MTSTNHRAKLYMKRQTTKNQSLQNILCNSNAPVFHGKTYQSSLGKLAYGIHEISKRKW